MPVAGAFIIIGQCGPQSGIVAAPWRRQAPKADRLPARKTKARTMATNWNLRVTLECFKTR
jgi:hypothetical protein